MLKRFGFLISLSFFCSMSLADTQTVITPVTAPKPIPQYSITIVSPKPEETFQNEAQSIPLTVAITPELEPEDRVIAYVDGNAVNDPIHSSAIELPWLERGSHTLQAKIIQQKGRGAESEIITIYQQRKSKLLP